MDSLVESLGLLSLAIQEGQGNEVGRTKLQKMIYFADRYLGWGVGDYSLHYYGPYSQNLAETLKTARNGLIEETKFEFGPYKYELTDDGKKFVEYFESDVCNDTQLQQTRELFKELSKWSKDTLELASTIDYVNKNMAKITKDELIAKVGIIKDNFTKQQITNAYDVWFAWKKSHNFT